MCLDVSEATVRFLRKKVLLFDLFMRHCLQCRHLGLSKQPALAVESEERLQAAALLVRLRLFHFCHVRRLSKGSAFCLRRGLS
jgi:hypothetical protein